MSGALFLYWIPSFNDCRFKQCEDILDDFVELFRVCKEFYPNAAIIYSGILPRWDADNNSVKEVNKEMQEVCDQDCVKYESKAIYISKVKVKNRSLKFLRESQ